jgi:hypothetical protein
MTERMDPYEVFAEDESDLDVFALIRMDWVSDRPLPGDGPR